MALSPLGAVGPTSLAGATPGAAGQSFGAVLKKQAPLEQPPLRAAEAPATHALPGPCRVGPAPLTAAPPSATAVLEQVTRAQQKMDELLRVAETGKTFSAAELLSLQTHVYRASQELDLAGKVVEKATGGVKQVLQTQV